MRMLSRYIKQHMKQSIHEGLDGNLKYLIRRWLAADDEKAEFTHLLDKYRGLSTPQAEDIQQLLSNTMIFKQHYKEFVDFVNNDIHPSNDNDYITRLKAILDTLIADKSLKI